MESNFQVRLVNSDRNKRTNRAWPKEDDLLLLDLLQKHTTIKDMERILDRTSTAIKNRRKVLISKNTGGRTTSRRRNPAQSISWRNMALQGLCQLPNQQGTFKDLAPVIEKMFGEQLNHVLLAGHSSYSVWRAQLSNVLADEKGFKAPRFESIGERHGKSLVYCVTEEGKRVMKEGFDNQKRGSSAMYETFLGGIFMNRRGKRFSENPDDSNDKDVDEDGTSKSVTENSSPTANVICDNSIEVGLVAPTEKESNLGFSASDLRRVENKKSLAKEFELLGGRIATGEEGEGLTPSHSYSSTPSPIEIYNPHQPTQFLETPLRSMSSTLVHSRPPRPSTSFSSPPTFRRSLPAPVTDLYEPISLPTYSHRHSISSDTSILLNSLPSRERIIINVMDREQLTRFIMNNETSDDKK